MIQQNNHVSSDGTNGQHIESPTDFKGRSVSFYHPNGKGSGSALRIEPKLNRNDTERYNCFFLELAPQKSMTSRGRDGVVPATFDWQRKITVKLDFTDVTEILAVLEGRTRKAGGERNGLYHASGGGNTLISFQQNAEQSTYSLYLSTKKAGETTPHKIGITLSEVEGIGVRCLFQTGLFFVTFSSLLRDLMRIPVYAMPPAERATAGRSASR